MTNVLNFRQIEGRNSVIEALKSPNKIFQVFLYEGAKGEKIEQIRLLARKKNISIFKKPAKFFKRLTKTGTSQGVIAQGEKLFPVSLESLLKKIESQGKTPFLVILPETLSEYNLGAVIRTCEAAKVDAVIISKKSSGATAVVNRVAMGAVEYIPIIQANLFEAVKRLKEEGFKIIGASAEKGNLYFKENLKIPFALIVGGENKDISDSLKERIDSFVKIPMFGKTTSLNLSVAASIIIFEAVRQRMM